MLIIYGAGDYGKRLYNFLNKKRIKVDCFAQTESPDTDTQMGLPVLSAKQLYQDTNKNIILIAMFDENTRMKIRQELYDRCVVEPEVYDFGSFIQGNLLVGVIGPLAYGGNDYEEGLSEGYWKVLSDDALILQGKADRLKDGLSEESKSLIDLTIERMMHMPNKGDRIFTEQERAIIRREEAEFVYQKSIEMIAGESWTSWRGYRIPSRYYMEPTVFYYGCGVPEIKDMRRVWEGDIIDAGAYIGDSSIVLSKFTGGTVHAFEAFPETFSEIERICFINGTTNVKAYNMALGDEDGEKEFHIGTYDVSNGLVERGGVDYKDRMIVKTTTIDSFVERNQLRIGMIKSDIEGGEPLLLEGARRTIKNQSPVLLISIYHTTDDFFGIKDQILEINPKYKIRVFRPMTSTNIITDTMLICEVEE